MENVTVHSVRINEFMFISPGGNSEKNCFSLLLKRSQVRWLVHLIRTRHPLERLDIPSSQGITQDPPGGTGKLCIGESCLEYPAHPAVDVPKLQLSGRKWIDILPTIYAVPSHCHCPD